MTIEFSALELGFLTGTMSKVKEERKGEGLAKSIYEKLLKSAEAFYPKKEEENVITV